LGHEERARPFNIRIDPLRIKPRIAPQHGVVKRKSAAECTRRAERESRIIDVPGAQARSNRPEALNEFGAKHLLQGCDIRISEHASDLDDRSAPLRLRAIGAG
jgi:hypothetical protein